MSLVEAHIAFGFSIPVRDTDYQSKSFKYETEAFEKNVLNLYKTLSFEERSKVIDRAGIDDPMDDDGEWDGWAGSTINLATVILAAIVDERFGLLSHGLSGESPSRDAPTEIIVFAKNTEQMSSDVSVALKDPVPATIEDLEQLEEVNRFFKKKDKPPKISWRFWGLRKE